jgi:hypothetical protein
MALQDDVRLAIDKNLSAEVGSILRQQLQEGESAANALLDVRRQLKNAEAKLESLEYRALTDKQRAEATAAAEKAAADLRKATTDKTIVDLKLEFAQQRVEDMRSIVLAVFANSRFKYTVAESGMWPMAPGQGGQWPVQQPFSHSASGEGEGSPPPPPIGATPR